MYVFVKLSVENRILQVAWEDVGAVDGEEWGARGGVIGPATAAIDLHIQGQLVLLPAPHRGRRGQHQYSCDRSLRELQHTHTQTNTHRHTHTNNNTPPEHTHMTRHTPNTTTHHTHTHTNNHTHRCMHGNIHTHMHTHTHTQIQTCTHIQRHTAHTSHTDAVTLSLGDTCQSSVHPHHINKKQRPPVRHQILSQLTPTSPHRDT